MRMLAWFFFFASRRRHTRCTGDWSSDVCSSDLGQRLERVVGEFVDVGDDDREIGAIRLGFELRYEIVCGTDGFGTQDPYGALRRDELCDRVAKPRPAGASLAFDDDPLPVAVAAFDLLAAAPKRAASAGQPRDGLTRAHRCALGDMQ